MTTAADFSSCVTTDEVDANARQVGVVYAKALFGAANKAGALEEVNADFEAVIGVLSQHRAFFDMLRLGAIPDEEQAKLFQRLFKDKAAPLFVNFLTVVALHGRARYLKAMWNAFCEMVDAHLGRARVTVSTAAALDDATTNRLTEGLQKALGLQPLLQPTIESALIGGVMLRVGDTVYDGSISTQLEKVRSQMIDRTVHEIQSRRDRFRTTAGN
jgi:F-type H+-transporting ATPase subunit delta